jgi:hypothetical protein
MPKRPTVWDNASRWRSRYAGNVKISSVPSRSGTCHADVDRLRDDKRDQAVRSCVASWPVQYKSDRFFTTCNARASRCPFSRRISGTVRFRFDATAATTILGTQLPDWLWLTALIRAHRACAEPIKPFLRYLSNPLAGDASSDKMLERRQWMSMAAAT